VREEAGSITPKPTDEGKLSYKPHDHQYGTASGSGAVRTLLNQSEYGIWQVGGARYDRPLSDISRRVHRSPGIKPLLGCHVRAVRCGFVVDPSPFVPGAPGVEY